MITQGNLIIAIAWILFYALHSILVTDTVKSLVKKQLNLNLWRKIYSFSSILGLLIILYLMAVTKESLIWKNNNLSKFVSMVFTTYGLIILRLTFKNYPLKKFLFYDDLVGKKPEDVLITTNIYSKVRHPIYSATLLIMIGLFLFIPKISTLISVLITLIYLPIGINLEEKKLINKYGRTYLSYKEQVPPIFPKLW